MGMRTEISFRLHVAVKYDEQARCWASYCPAVDVYSAGKDEDLAKKAIESAILMFVRNCFRRRILDDVLVGRGFVPDEPVDMIGKDGEPADASEQYITVRLREFGGETFPVDIKMPLSTLSPPECRA